MEDRLLDGYWRMWRCTCDAALLDFLPWSWILSNLIDERVVRYIDRRLDSGRWGIVLLEHSIPVHSLGRHGEVCSSAVMQGESAEKSDFIKML